MSPNPIRQALYTKLAGTAGVTSLLSASDAIYHERADEDGQRPYIVFSKNSGTPDRRFGASVNRIDRDVWLVKAICEGESASAAEAIAAAIDTALDRQTLTVTGRATLICERQSDVHYPESDGDKTYHHVGALYRVWTQP